VGLYITSFHRRKVRAVYLIRSVGHPRQTYIGVTSNITQRLKDHNAGKSVHTNKYAPWKLVAAVWFTDTQKANAFERYLKTGSGRAFTQKHLW
jgi:putative endonuclease